jgi:hypothetical protein
MMGMRAFLGTGRVGAMAVLVGLAVAGCQGDGSGSPGSSSSPSGSAGSGAGAGVAATAGRTATAYPVPASATPEQLPSLGSRTDGRWTLVLNGVRRSGEGAVVVTGTLTNSSPSKQLFSGFEEAGYSLRKGPDGKLNSTYEFSAVTLTVPGSTTQYQVMRDGSGVCACTQGVISVDKGISQAVYAVVTAPAQALVVTVTVAGFAPFTGVQVQS